MLQRLVSVLLAILLLGAFQVISGQQTINKNNMPPKDLLPTNDDDTAAAAAATNGGEPQQYLYIVRHGDRWDYENRDWPETTERPGDPPLSSLGLQQAAETGQFLDQQLAATGCGLEQITWLSSPFLRTLQTSDTAISQLKKVAQIMSNDQHQDDAAAAARRRLAQFPIQPEYSVFEWDGKGGAWHRSLPELSERVHYFPRLNIQHQSLFVPTLPEPRSEFHGRCQRAVRALEERYPVLPAQNSAIVVCTHAAGCIGLIQAAIETATLQDITPAGPCSVYRLTRTARTGWTMDPPDTGLNGHVEHLSDMGTNTVPWNHFGDKKINLGYTGPPNSRFAPPKQQPDEEECNNKSAQQPQEAEAPASTCTT